MFYNYLKIALRNLMRHKVFSFINLFGLALGMAGTLLIGLWVYDEYSYNCFYPASDRLYAVRMLDGDYTSLITNSPLTEALKADIPAVEKATKLSWQENLLLQVGDKSFKQPGYYASSDFFDVFQFPVLQGNPQRALQTPNNIVITREVANIYFGTVNAVGKTIQFDNNKSYAVGAVIENVPTNSSLQFNWIVNFKVIDQDWMHIWSNYSFTTYVKLRPGVMAAQAEASMRGIMQKYDPDPRNSKVQPILQPLADVYLYSEYEHGQAIGGRIKYLRLFSLVAVFTLLIACVNFMNLSTARSAGRAREVGVRKVIGAGRSSLLGQFMGESLLMVLLALLLALAIVTLALPALNTLTQKQLSLNLTSPALGAGLLGLALITGLLAGSYPALFLSSLQPVRVLKGAFKTGANAALMRKGLVVFQFVLSIFLIVGMLVVSRQMHYLRTKNLGLDRENVFYVPVEGNLGVKRDVFRQELLRSDAVKAVTTTGSLPIDIQSNTTGNLVWPGKDPKNREETVWQMHVGNDFLKTMRIPLLSGRDFREGSTSDSVNILINESAAKLIGIPDPVGQPITFQRQKGRIIGLMKDFHLASLHQPIQPLVIQQHPNWTNYILIRSQSGRTADAIAVAEKLSRQINPAYPFDYHFLDEEYEKLYRNEMLIGSMVNTFGLVAILISCLGLFGLATYTAEQRTKEIGIRKVLGASVTGIVSMLSKDFLKLVLIATIIAWPLAWYVMQQWLQNFAYRTSFSWWIFALAGALAVFIALLTVSFQAIKAAVANPVKALRSE